MLRIVIEFSQTSGERGWKLRVDQKAHGSRDLYQSMIDRARRVSEGSSDVILGDIRKILDDLGRRSTLSEHIDDI